VPISQTVAVDTDLNNAGPFVNLQQGTYWSGTEYAPVNGGVWNFNFSNGGQGAVDKSNRLFAWAVRPGDVASTIHLIFKTVGMCIAECDTRATLTGNLYDGIAIEGSDSFVSRKCPKHLPS